MKFLKYSLIPMMITMIFVSCDPGERYKSELAQIDSCLVVMDTLEKQFDGIEFDSLNIMVEHVKKNEALIKQYYTADTLNEAFGKQMTDCKHIRKRLKNSDRERVKYGDELNAVKHQFIDLKEDILNGLFDDEQIKEYLAIEIEALKKVDFAFSDFYKVQNEEKNRYYVVVPKVDLFINNLIKESENKVD